MSTEQWLDFVGISMDPKKADGIRFVANLVTPDNGEKYVVEVSNATLTALKGFQAAKPDLTVTVNRAELNRVMMGQASFDDLIGEGKAKFDGSRAGFDQLRSILVAFTPTSRSCPARRRSSAPSRPSRSRCASRSISRSIDRETSPMAEAAAMIRPIAMAAALAAGLLGAGRAAAGGLLLYELGGAEVGLAAAGYAARAQDAVDRVRRPRPG